MRNTIILFCLLAIGIGGGFYAHAQGVEPVGFDLLAVISAVLLLIPPVMELIPKFMRFMEDTFDNKDDEPSD